MSPDELRQRYLRFFEEKCGHRHVDSSPVVPDGDPTLLFTNAGMNQFKDVLLGLEKRDYVRAVSVQKCIRAGGKHNDLDEVGKDGRHLTFFEMLGNWSFGDYYKKEAIIWAWQFVTEELGLAAERLYVSVYKDDDEAWDFWEHEVGVPTSRIVRLGDIDEGDEENFWSMGPTGPCGPCTEIYYDHHPEAGAVPWEPGFDEERFVEIWNLVFMAFDRDETGELTPLPLQSVDTGMGLDRVAAILGGVDNVFHTGLFAGILARTHALRTGSDFGPERASELFDDPHFIEYCVIADHIRTLTFSIVDGAKFSNEGRGYVLRRILRRAVRHGRNLGFEAPFLCDVVSAVIDSFGHVYRELRLKGKDAARIIRTEEARFFKTLDRGIALFEEVAEQTSAAGESTIDGATVFQLYDTFGFPPDLTEIMAEECGLKVDLHGYEAAMQQQRKRSRAADDRYTAAGEWQILQDGAADTFVGYDRYEHTSDVLRIRQDPETDIVEICVRETPFYSESGGQVGDVGRIESADGALALDVFDTRKTVAGMTHFARIAHGELNATHLREPAILRVDERNRFLCAANHTATHLLHAALHEIVSRAAFQAGSMVSAERLRFDFNHDESVTDVQLDEIEATVNTWIRQNHRVRVHRDVPIDAAEKMGATMMFGEKYGAEVRVVEVLNSPSIELCGGTHVGETNDIAFFRIVAESGVAAGVRRIEAVTNEGAFALANAERRALGRIAGALKVSPQQAEERLEKLLSERRQLEEHVAELSRMGARATAAELISSATAVDGIAVIASKVDARDRDQLVAIADYLRDLLGEHGVALLGADIDGRPALLAMATEAAARSRGLKAGVLVRESAAHIGGKGGGKPTLAQAGGSNVAGLLPAIDAFPALVAHLLT